MQSLKSFAEDIINQSKAGKINAQTGFWASDIAVRVFVILHDQKIELRRLKMETSSHAWVREQNGILVLVPLDNEFAQLQQQIAILENKISTNQKVADALDRVFNELQLEPPTAALTARIREIQTQIMQLNESLTVNLAPFQRAAQLVAADLEKIPEVLRLRDANAIQVAALENESRAIETKFAKIQEILQAAIR